MIVQNSGLSSSSVRIVCTVCPHGCSLAEGKTGICGVRTVENGRIISLSYGKATSVALDPIEKKPLANFHPGSYILSYGSFGCNLRCPFCQNSDIAMATIENPVQAQDISPEDLVKKALVLKDSGNIGIAFTYNEPFVAWEFMMDTARLAHEADLLTVAVTNGYVSSDTWIRTLPYIDAFNIDLKCFSERGYRSLNAPNGLASVKDSIESAYQAGNHIEVTTLVVPSLSDDEDEFIEECSWLRSISPDIALHISRFFPCYMRSGDQPTDIALLYRFLEIAKGYLNNVYLGNV